MTTEPPLFSRRTRADDVTAGGLDVTIVADDRERAALARANTLVAIGRLEATFHLTRISRGVVRAEGELVADITQTCVVSLEPFDTTVREDIDVKFAAAAEDRPKLRGATPPVIDLTETDEPPDPIIDGRIDLGALAAEFFALGLDPYPRKPGVEFAAPEIGGPESPFAIFKAPEPKDR
jgi:hypothetical protein